MPFLTPKGYLQLWGKFFSRSYYYTLEKDWKKRFWISLQAALYNFIYVYSIVMFCLEALRLLNPELVQPIHPDFFWDVAIGILIGVFNGLLAGSLTRSANSAVMGFIIGLIGGISGGLAY